MNRMLDSIIKNERDDKTNRNKKPRFRNRGLCCDLISTSGATKSAYFKKRKTRVTILGYMDKQLIIIEKRW